MPPVLRLALLLVLIASPVHAQVVDTLDVPVAPTPVAERLASYAARQARRQASPLANVPARSIGPTVMSGRVVDVDVSPDDPARYYVAYASGGLWKTTTGGIAFTPLFEREAAMTIGDVAVDWAHSEAIWVGTGENNSSRSSYAGTGVYRSRDGGRTWAHLGLDETHRIGRIVLHPSDTATAWVAALGALYAPGPHRGVYKTTDGGRSWRRTLFVDDTTGVVDLVVDPRDPQTLYAAAWHRLRRAWDFTEAGAGSGLYKSTDGGETWTRLHDAAGVFPDGPALGRVGLALHAGAPGVLYALVDNQARRPDEEDEDTPALTRDMLRTMTTEAFLALGEEELEDYLQRNGFPAAYTVQSILEMVRDGEIAPAALVDYLEDANANLFDTPVVGAEVYRSDDGGHTWRRTHEGYLDNVYFSYGYYFGQIRVAPDDPDRVYVLGVPILRSDDGGRTFVSIGGDNVHVDHHALWVSPVRPGHLIGGNDGGVNVSFDDGATWFKANTPPVGQFYAVAVDSAAPYRVYGGLQDNGVWVGPSTYEAGYGWYEEGDYPYDRLLGGDGMQVEVDTRTNDVVYTGFQFGNYFRIDRSAGERTSIKPRHALGERPLRFNWETPIHLSRHHRDILYLGSHRVHRSLDRGDTWEAVSPDLTRGGRPGDVPYGTLTALDESPLRFGLLYAGSDDGLLHVSRDGGHAWTRISDPLPQHLWVSHVAASAHAEGRVYAALNGYRWDHFAPYLYRSDDYGATWTRLGADLPMEPVNVVVEDPERPDLLYVGTDHGLYASLDGGATFHELGGLPAAPVHDLAVHRAMRELVVATHGRSLYVVPLEHVQRLTPDVLARPLHVFDLEPVTYDEDWGDPEAVWAVADTPSVVIPYVAGSAGTAVLRVEAADGTLLQTLSVEAGRGLNYARYDLTADSARAAAWQSGRPASEHTAEPAANGKVYLPPGTYTVEVRLGDAAERVTLDVKAPPEPPRRGEARRRGP